MSEKLEQMLRIALMNQVEIMMALEELLGLEPETDDDLATQGEIRANLSEAIELTIESLKSFKEPGAVGSDNLAGQA